MIPLLALRALISRRVLFALRNRRQRIRLAFFLLIYVKIAFAETALIKGLEFEAVFDAFLLTNFEILRILVFLKNSKNFILKNFFDILRKFSNHQILIKNIVGMTLRTLNKPISRTIGCFSF